MAICCHLYWWFAMNPSGFIRQKHGSQVRGKHAPNPIAANNILLLAFLQHGRRDVKCKPSQFSNNPGNILPRYYVEHVILQCVILLPASITLSAS
jgi:hypothetical protein